MSRSDPKKLADGAAIQFMVLDILGDLLAFSENPGRMGGYLTQQLRELVGARLVLLLQYSSDAAPPRIVALEPERQRDSGRLDHLDALVRLSRPLEAAALWQRQDGSREIDALLEALECQALAVCPLRVGSELVGGFFAIDLLDTHRGIDMVRLLELLAPVVALALRNSLFYESMEARIQERTRERLQLEAQLQQAQKLESMGRLAGGVAHDINNMLGAMMAHLELMEAKLPEADPLRRHTEQMGKAALRSRDIVRQLLAFSRKQIIAPEVLDVNRRIEETRRTLAPLLGEDLELVFQPGAGLWNIRFDPAQFDQILMNLAVNARDAMPGGGRIFIETSNCHLDSSLGRENPEALPGSYVLLTFGDEGCGMDPETLSHIFEPFFTTKEAGKGTGLGLATVFGVVRQSGGFLKVTSEVRAGSTFRIYLPAHLAAPAPPEPPMAPPSAGSGRVLLVEDDEVLRMVIPSMLEGLGYQVCLADHPAHALELCSRSEPSFRLMLTDIVMPGMSGKELWERVRGLRPEMGVLFMSGYTAELITQRGVPDEEIHFIQKPFSILDLGRKLNEALRVCS